jgi:hypothetical protein
MRKRDLADLGAPSARCAQRLSSFRVAPGAAISTSERGNVSEQGQADACHEQVCGDERPSRGRGYVRAGLESAEDQLDGAVDFAGLRRIEAACEVSEAARVDGSYLVD